MERKQLVDVNSIKNDKKKKQLYHSKKFGPRRLILTVTANDGRSFSAFLPQKLKTNVHHAELGIQSIGSMLK